MSGRAPREGSFDFSLSKQGIETHNTVGDIAGTRQQSATARVGQNSLAHTRLKQTLVQTILNVNKLHSIRQSLPADLQGARKATQFSNSQQISNLSQITRNIQPHGQQSE